MITGSAHAGPPPDETPSVVMGVAKEGGSQYTGPAVVKIGGIKPPSHRCFCAPPRPADAEEVLSKLMDSWTDIPLKQLLVRLQRRPKQKGYKPKLQVPRFSSKRPPLFVISSNMGRFLPRT
jgi:hypothetical protein